MLDKSAATGNDLQTERAVSEALTYDPLLAGRMPRIGVDEGTVTLEGNVRSAQARHQAEQDALNVVGVTYVTNKLIVQPTRSVADSKLSRDVVRRLNNDPDLEASAIQVSVHSGVVRLSGFVPNRWERQLAERDIGAVVGVRQIEDVLVPRETRIRPADDSALRREVLLELGMNPYLDPEAISVSVANGVVTLTGAVLHTQAYNEAIAAARQAGARRVVAKLSLDNGLPAVSVMPPSMRGQTSSLGTNPHAEGTVLGSVEQATEQSEAATP
jgi:osmotically-inducible protein OsmY